MIKHMLTQLLNKMQIKNLASLSYLILHPHKPQNKQHRGRQKVSPRKLWMTSIAHLSVETIIRVQSVEAMKSCSKW